MKLPSRIRRVLQVIAVDCVVEGFWGGPFWATVFVVLLFSPFWYLSLAYLAWMLYDRNTPRRGGRKTTWFRKLGLWKHYADYFPATLHKTAELDPHKNYIVGYHPHGAIVMGAFASFVFPDACGSSQLYPGIDMHLVTVYENFCFPFSRELWLMGGACSSEKTSVEYLLSKNGKGNAVVIVLGAAQEALETAPGKMDLTLKDRKGFVKVAIRNGASLVPSICFGENEVYYTKHFPESSKAFRIQRKLTDWFTFPFLPAWGRGLLVKRFGLLPLRKPLHIFVGKPIEVTKNANPTLEEINQVHTEYVNALTQLFNSHKAKYAANPNMNLLVK